MYQKQAFIDREARGQIEYGSGTIIAFPNLFI
jgi:hypothetical protein